MLRSCIFKFAVNKFYHIKFPFFKSFHRSLRSFLNVFKIQMKKNIFISICYL